MSSSAHVQSPLMNAQRGKVRRSILWPALALLIGALFVWTGAMKAWDPMMFSNDISHYQILSYPLAIRLAFYLPWLEIVCGLALIFGWLRPGAVAILTALTVVFIGASIVARMRGIDVTCGCFGSAGKGLTFSWHLAIDFALLGGLLALCFSPLTSRTSGRG
jgi:putative oxidoreductase